MNGAGTIKIDTGTFWQVECEDKSAVTFIIVKYFLWQKLTSKSLKEANKIFDDIQQDIKRKCSKSTTC